MCNRTFDLSNGLGNTTRPGVGVELTSLPVKKEEEEQVEKEEEEEQWWRG